ncbi:haloacid dehalogenase-like hydrolase [Rhodococcus sp. NPDC127528]|uniref:haloacid dehalogenase-like hydrolase n=1 Tax=unclassified Rhodococcus (in: high G+C Gram-positive bacteria) TaxID=192944 RepID=UPI0036424EF7
MVMTHARATMWAGTAAAALVLVTGCGANTPTDDAAPTAAASECGGLDPALQWYGDNRAALDRLIAERGDCSGGGDVAAGAPLALFDWDNTVVKNDIGSATAYWMIKNDKILQPAGANWSSTSRFLTPAAADALSAACGTETAPGRALPTSTDTGCADEIVAVLDERTRTGRPAFQGYDHRRTKAAYAWAVQLMAGHSEQEVAAFAEAARAENLAAPEGAEQTVGSTRVDGYVRYYPQIADLVKTLRANGFDVRIISASAEPVVRVWARELGLAPDRVMGVRPVVADGVLSGHLVGCGGVPDGEDSVIPYIDGKRCQVNEVVFGVRGPAAFDPLPTERRQVFAAGDSVTDVTFLSDATGGRLVINRNNAELMCNAYDNADGRWLVNPMFLDPKGRADAPYPCSATAFTAADGAKAPVHRADGTVIADQVDAVF